MKLAQNAKPEKQTLRNLSKTLKQQEEKLRQGGGEKGTSRQKRLGRLTARERLEQLLDDPNQFFELGLFAAYGMYEEWGELPAAGVITGIGNVSGRPCMLVINDATVKAGAMFPQSVKKVLRAQRIAFECRLPLLYLVDSSGVFLPLQEDIFPDEDDFGRIFRNNAVLSAAGIPQFAAIMGNCIAGGGYLPVLCDKLLMTEGSGLYLAGPALVKAAIGQETDPEELGGAAMHSAISGTVDFHEKDDISCLKKLRDLVGLLPESFLDKREGHGAQPEKLSGSFYDQLEEQPYDIHKLLPYLIDKDCFIEYKAEYGKALVCAYAKIDGIPVGIVASQREHTLTGKGQVEIGGVLYADSADKAARFVMECNQTETPLLFLQDVVGFMVGKEAEQSGIIRAGAKLVNAVSNSIVPKITVIIGDSFGAGHYALCGKAYDPNFILAWPNAKYAVMGAQQAAGTLLSLQKTQDEESRALYEKMLATYQKQMDIRYGAARGWVDAIIAPHETREALVSLLHYVRRAPLKAKPFHTGVIQV